MMKKIINFLIFSSICTFISAQTDKGVFISYPSGFYDFIMKELGISDDGISEKPKSFKMDFSGKIYPTDISKYNVMYHCEPVSQGYSGTCWAYAAVSYMESEVFRQQKIKIKLSEMFVAYWEYIARAEEFVKTKGATNIGEGSQANAILRVMKNYGMIPLEIYSGIKNNQRFNDHTKLFNEFYLYLNEIREKELWDMNVVIANTKAILDKYMGAPPTTFRFENKEYTPQTFMTEYLKLNPNRYFCFMSSKKYSYNEMHEFESADNWWHSNNFYNINLQDYIDLIKHSISSGYTIAICGDVTEPGYDQISEVGVIPDFDIPAKYINEDARQLRLSNNTTTDDHCIHIVGYEIFNGDYWFLIKDSGSGAFDGKNKGYRFYHEDYVKLKVMNFMIHVDAAKKILDGIIK